MTKLKHHENYLISMHLLNSARLKKCDPHSKKTTTWHTLSKMIGESVFIGNHLQVDTFIFWIYLTILKLWESECD